ncbi:MAG: flagellar assembly protein FliW [Bacillota bacterium]
MDESSEMKISFRKGLPGFEGIKEFVLRDNPGSIFYWLIGLPENQVRFLLVDPFVFFPKYTFDLDDRDKENLIIENPRDVLVFAIVSIPEKVSLATANLLAPIIINRTTWEGQQVILENSPYTTKHRLFENDRLVKEG